MDVLRWWFTLNYDAVQATEGRDAFAFKGQGVKVLSENEMLNAKGERVHTGKSDELNSQFASSFTKRLRRVKAKAFEFFAQFAQLLLQRFLLLLQVFQGFCKLLRAHRFAFLALSALFAWLRLLAILTVLLLLAVLRLISALRFLLLLHFECIVEQLLLLAHQFAQLVQRLVHLVAFRLLLLLVAAGPQIVHHALQFAQHLAGRIP